ncbi:MAG: alginate O-acetyltransferase AlgX-related protein [Candidatus Krumholzibacteriia bacterium]
MTRAGSGSSSAARRRVPWLALLALPAVLLWGELFTRILLPQSVDRVMEILAPDPVLGYVYAPGAVARETGLGFDVPYVIDRLGLRDREYDLADTTACRVLLVGDSYAVGHAESVQYSLPRALERALRRTDGGGGRRPIQVINAANAGYGPYQYGRAWRKWGPLLRPDVVLVALALANDWEVDPDDARFLVRQGRLEAVYREGEPPPSPRTTVAQGAREWLSRHSQFYVLLRNYLRYDPQTRWLRPARPAPAGWRAPVVPGRVAADPDGGRYPTPVRPFLRPVRTAVTEGWERAVRDLVRLRDEAAAAGVPVMVALVPTVYQVVPGRAERMLRNQGLRADGIDLLQPNRQVAALCAAAGLPCVDLLPALRARQARTPCYYRFDDHWNRDGVAAAADTLAAIWRARGWPPCDASGAAGGAPSDGP